MKDIAVKYGYFDDANREYAITRPDTPLPWINYLGSQEYFGLISNTAGGYTFFKDARLRRLTRYRYNNAPLDMGGRYLYLRDNAPEAAEPRYWSPTWMPTRSPLDSYECRPGRGHRPRHRHPQLTNPAHHPHQLYKLPTQLTSFLQCAIL